MLRVSSNMDAIPEGGVVTAVQKAAQLAAMYLRTLASEPWDSGFDSDEPTPFRPSLEISDESSDEDFLDNMIKDKKDPQAQPLKDMGGPQHEGLDILIKWRQNIEIRESSLSEIDRSSPPLYEVELTASDEDDDASVLELVIPMQSRYQRVPTSSPKKAKPKNTTLLSALFCCMRK